jgi:hypothetical protein
MEWIKLIDQLPNEDDIYLKYPNKYTYTAYYHKYGKYVGKWTNDDVNGYEYIEHVTHWQPLPKDPK